MEPLALDVAEELLRGATSEAAYRAATSRAYYAAFQHVLAHPKLQDFRRSSSGEDHKLLIQHLKNSADPDLRRLGYDHIPRMRALRNKADYDTEVPFTRKLAEEALDRASEIIHDFLPVDS